MERHQVAGGCAGEKLPAITLELAAANRTLEQRRQAFRLNQIERQTTLEAHGRFKSPDFPTVPSARPNLKADIPHSLPHHLGWHSGPVTRLLRRALDNQSSQPSPTPATTTENNPTPCRGGALCPPSVPSEDHSGHDQYLSQNSEIFAPANKGDHKGSPLQDVSTQTVTVPPDIAVAILRQKLAAPGRIWLLMRHVDQDGRGWLTAESARQSFTDKASPLAVCGKRQLRNLLAAGDGIFWERDEERIWLRSLVKVAAVLGLERLHGRSVQLPLTPLLQTIGTVRAHLYATFHSGRANPDDISARNSRPISRKTLKKLTSATRRTQRLYEKRTGVRQKTNYAVGSQHTAEGEQNAAWKLGQAYFRFTDKKGLLGPQKQQYLAWQLPNSYDGPHETESKGHQRRLNRQLTDLLTIGITGNGECESIKTGDDDSDTNDGYRKKLFYGQSHEAAKKYNREPDQDLYWRSRGMSKNRSTFWHIVPARPVDNPK